MTSIPFPKFNSPCFDPISCPLETEVNEEIPGFVSVKTKYNDINKRREYRSEVFFKTYKDAYNFWERVKKCDALKDKIAISPHREVPQFHLFPEGIPPMCSIHPFDVNITRPFGLVMDCLNGKEIAPVKMETSSAVILERMKRKFPPIPGSHEERKMNKSHKSSKESQDSSGVDTESSQEDEVNADEPFLYWGDREDNGN